MSDELVVQANGPYLRVVLPDLETDWEAVWTTVDFELEDGIGRAELVAPAYRDEESLAGISDLVGRLERNGIDTTVVWIGEVPALAGSE